MVLLLCLVVRGKLKLSSSKHGTASETFVVVITRLKNTLSNQTVVAHTEKSGHLLFRDGCYSCFSRLHQRLRLG